MIHHEGTKARRFRKINTPNFVLFASSGESELHITLEGLWRYM